MLPVTRKWGRPPLNHPAYVCPHRSGNDHLTGDPTASLAHARIDGVTVSMADDGSTLLTGPAVQRAAGGRGGARGGLAGLAGGWTTSTPIRGARPRPRTRPMVDWPTGRREELLGASARVGGRSGNDDRAMVFGDGDREVAVWLYPDDPDLPGLRRASAPAEVAAILAEHQVLPQRPEPDQVRLEMISYRPRRRAVLKVGVDDPGRSPDLLPQGAAGVLAGSDPGAAPAAAGRRHPGAGGAGRDRRLLRGAAGAAGPAAGVRDLRRGDALHAPRT